MHEGVLWGFPYTSVAVKPLARIGRSKNAIQTSVFIDIF
jgi:hypothetical protein